MKNKTNGEILLDLKTRARLSLDQIAKAAGYSRRSSVQEYFKAEFNRPLSRKAAEKLIIAMVGAGDPPIEAGDIF